jgi:PAS domain S-box-containing protein
MRLILGNRRLEQFARILIVMLFVIAAGFFGSICPAAPPDGASESPKPGLLQTLIVDNYFPYTFMNKQGLPDGFSVELAKAVARVMGMGVVIRADTWQQAVNALQSGQIDFLPMMAYSKERDRVFDFSAPHTIGYDAFFTRKDAGKIRSMEDLRGKRVIVMKNDQADEFIKNSGLVDDQQFIRIAGLPEGLRLLSSGEGDVALMPKLVGLIHIRNLRLTNLELSPLVVDSYNRPFCFAVREGNQALLEKLSQGLNIVKATGEYQAIYSRWFGELEPHGISFQTALTYAAIGVSIFSVIGLLLLAWSVMLRRQVRIRTLELQAEIAERLQAEEKLSRQSEFLFILLETIPLPVYYKDVHGKYIGCNRAFEAFTGFIREDIIGKTIYDIAPEEVADNHFQRDMELLESPGKQSYEYSLKEKDGRMRQLIFNKATIIDIHGKIEGMIGVISDITERKKAEEERECLQDQLLQAHKMESIGRLAGGVAHDFNNMIMVILGNTDIVMEEMGLSHPLYPNLEEILKSAQRSADLTRQLLAFARKQTISPKVLDLNDMVSGMLKMLQRLIGEDVDLAWKPATALWQVRMDPSQIDQILVNLSVNARDAITGVGKMTIETGNVVFDKAYCAAHVGFIPGEYVLLAVSDTGCGMEEEALECLFEPFYTTKEVGKGTGLGLATVYGIVKQNHGFINVYSEPGQGTAFKIYLPRTQPTTLPATSAAGKEPAGGNETVLLVEDEPAILKLGKIILERYGYRVLATRVPREALALAERHPGPIHLLITDVVMPRMNGRDLRENITAVRPAIKTLFMSGYTANVIAHHGVLEEGIDFLQKPFSVHTLASKVRGVLDRLSKP